VEVVLPGKGINQMLQVGQKLWELEFALALPNDVRQH
jgi:hypothetical protein